MIRDELQKQIAEKQGSVGFIKTADIPVASLSSGQKAELNRLFRRIDTRRRCIREKKRNNQSAQAVCACA